MVREKGGCLKGERENRNEKAINGSGKSVKGLCLGGKNGRKRIMRKKERKKQKETEGNDRRERELKI